MTSSADPRFEIAAGWESGQHRQPLSSVKCVQTWLISSPRCPIPMSFRWGTTRLLSLRLGSPCKILPSSVSREGDAQVCSSDMSFLEKFQKAWSPTRSYKCSGSSVSLCVTMRTATKSTQRSSLIAAGQVDDLSLDYPRCIEMLTEVIIRQGAWQGWAGLGSCRGSFFRRFLLKIFAYTWRGVTAFLPLDTVTTLMMLIAQLFTPLLCYAVNTVPCHLSPSVRLSL